MTAAPPQWARVRGDANCRVRRGAWYEVVRLTSEEAVLCVGDRSLGVDRSFLQIVPTRPDRWSVVPPPARRGEYAAELGFDVRGLSELLSSQIAAGPTDRAAVSEVQRRLRGRVG